MTSELRTQQPDEAAWDAFVQRAPGGSFRQTTRWAALKACQGWVSHLVVVPDGGAPVAGAQLLLKPVPHATAAGRIAYCPKGPILESNDPDLAERTVDTLARTCRALRVRALVVQPPGEAQALEPAFANLGCLSAPVSIAPEATALIDLAPDLDAVEGRMSKKHRQNLRRAAASGVVIRRGDERDLPSFHRLHAEAAERLRYRAFPLSYYQRMWRLFEPGGDVQLFLAEHHEQLLSAQLVLVFGDTVHGMARGWSAEARNVSTNDLMDWGTITWAVERGLRHYDLESLDRRVAEAVLAGADRKALQLRGSDAYKLKWSSDVRLFPVAQLYVPNPVVRRIYRNAAPKLSASRHARRALKALRTS